MSWITPPGQNHSPWTYRKWLLAWNLIAPVLALWFFFQGNHWLALATMVSAHAPLFAAMLIPSCQWFGPVINRFTTNDNEIWITIDDGPDPADTPAILDLLDAYQAKATFFCIGQKANDYPELIERIREAGHGLGNHTWSHRAGWLWAAGPGFTKSEIEKTDAILADNNQAPRPLPFRAPAGLKNPWMHRILGRQRPLVGWSARGLDGIMDNADDIMRRIFRTLQPGGIVLIHEGRTCRSGERLGPRILEKLLRECQHRQWKAIIPDQTRWTHSRSNTPR